MVFRLHQTILGPDTSIRVISHCRRRSSLIRDSPRLNALACGLREATAAVFQAAAERVRIVKRHPVLQGKLGMHIARREVEHASSTSSRPETITPSGGFAGTVSFTASGLPAGVTAAFSPSSATARTTLTLTASSTATVGSATVTVTGASGTLTHTLSCHNAKPTA